MTQLGGLGALGGQAALLQQVGCLLAGKEVVCIVSRTAIVASYSHVGLMFIIV